MIKSFVHAMLVTMLLGFAHPAAAIVLFEDNFDSDTPGLTVTDLNNFTVASGTSVDVIGAGTGFDPAQYQGNGLYLDSAGTGTPPGTIVSKVTFNPGTYVLRLRLGGPIYGNSTSQLSVSLGDFAETFDLTGLQIADIVRTAIVSAVSGSPLVFADAGTSLNNSNIGSTIFGVQVATVPEPATLSLLGAGLLGLGLAMRRRRETT